MIAEVVEAGGIVETLAKLAEPWAKVFAHSKAVSAGVTYLHLVPLITAGGIAYATDRATLRVMKSGIDQRSAHLRQLADIHRVVLIGLVISFVSGILLFLSDVGTFLGSVYIWIKLGLVFLLLANGFTMTRTEKALNGSGKDAALWDRMRMLAVLSMLLWLATALAGVVLKEFA
ncbi:MAG: hypothetical protein JWM95_5402 [Gemmatimonadetes bacterium]|nr:hypothetical protein [Gemmatimonadota bacterium]